MPVYKVVPRDPEKTPGGVRMVRGDLPQQVARYLSRQYEISSMTTDDMVPLITLGIPVEDARPTREENEEENQNKGGTQATLAQGSFTHKMACPAVSTTPIGGLHCICFKLDSESGWRTPQTGS